ncbi:MAG: cytochrome c oxidase accessory protein CcoG, partial [Alphaproteobacteria bacterium]
MNKIIDVEEALSTRAQQEVREGKRKIPAEDQPFYANRVRVYPKSVKGTFRKVKWAVLGVLLTIYYVVPWIRWDRGGGASNQAVHIDIVQQRFYFFWIEIWPQEIYYFVGLLVLAAVGLFLATSLAGRVWCGYACPQTVWTDIFMWVERAIEGDRSKRIRLDRGRLSAGKAAKKVAKHGVWLFISLFTGGAWIMYFVDAPSLVSNLFTGRIEGLTLFFIGLFTVTTYLLAGWAREQVCTYMCPWPRFQSAMFDEDTLIVTYQKWRGEDRGVLTPKTDWSKRGDCVDCNACVAVCPTGIDIRDGQQLECISCALCIDACNAIMKRVGRPPNLIAYDTIYNQTARAASKPTRFRLIRPRTLIYGVCLLAVGAATLIAFALRTNLDINVLHDRNPLFVRLSDGSIRNGYTIKILNKQRATRNFSLALKGLSGKGVTGKGLSGARFRVVGQLGTGATVILSAKPDQVSSYKIYLTLRREALTSARTAISFVLTDRATRESAARDSFFSSP